MWFDRVPAEICDSAGTGGDVVDDGDYRWVDDIGAVDLKELSNLYPDRAAWRQAA